MGWGKLFTVWRSGIPGNRHTTHTPLQSRSTLVAPAHTPQFLHRLRACISLIPHHEPVPAEDVGQHPVVSLRARVRAQTGRLVGIPCKHVGEIIREPLILTVVEDLARPCLPSREQQRVANDFHIDA